MLRDVRLTVGGEPTFVSIDDREGGEWTFDADGPVKRRLAEDLVFALRDHFAPERTAARRSGQVVSGRTAAALGQARLLEGRRRAAVAPRRPDRPGGPGAADPPEGGQEVRTPAREAAAPRQGPRHPGVRGPALPPVAGVDDPARRRPRGSRSGAGRPRRRRAPGAARRGPRTWPRETRRARAAPDVLRRRLGEQHLGVPTRSTVPLPRVLSGGPAPALGPPAGARAARRGRRGDRPVRRGRAAGRLPRATVGLRRRARHGHHRGVHRGPRRRAARVPAADRGPGRLPRR